MRKCKICADSNPIQTKPPRHITRQNLEGSDEDLCDKCLFEIERHVFSVKNLTGMWTITWEYDKWEYDKCTRLANFYNCAWQ